MSDSVARPMARDAVLPIGAFAIALLVNLIHTIDANWGLGLLSAYARSDAYYYWHKAWVTAFLDPGGGELAHIIPLSPYVTLLAWALKTFGPDPAVPFVVNAVLAGVAAAFTALTTRILFGPIAGIIAALMLSLSGPLVFYAGLTVKTTVELALLAVSIYCAVRYLSQGSPMWVALAAAAATLLTIERNNMAVLLVVMTAIVLVHRPGWRQKAVGVGLTATATAAVAFATSWQLNTLEQRFFSPVGLNFYVGAAPGAHGAYTHIKDIRNDLVGHHTTAVDVAERAAGRELSRSEVSRYWFQRAFDSIVSDPAGYVQLQAEKALLLGSHVAPGAPEEYRIWRKERIGLRIAFIDYGLVLSLFVVGLWAVRAQLRDPRLQLLLFTLAAYAASLWVFFVIERYRVPMLLLMSPFAAAAIQCMARARRTVTAKLVCAALALYGLTILATSQIPGQPGWVKDPIQARGNELRVLQKLTRSYELREQVVEKRTWAPWADLSRDLYLRGLRDDAQLAVDRAMEAAPNEPQAYWTAFTLASRSKDATDLVQLRRQIDERMPFVSGDRHRNFLELRHEIDRRLALKGASDLKDAVSHVGR